MKFYKTKHSTSPLDVRSEDWWQGRAFERGYSWTGYCHCNNLIECNADGSDLTPPEPPEDEALVEELRSAFCDAYGKPGNSFRDGLRAVLKALRAKGWSPKRESRETEFGVTLAEIRRIINQTII